MNDISINALFSNSAAVYTSSHLKNLIKNANYQIKNYQISWFADLLQRRDKPFQTPIKPTDLGYTEEYKKKPVANVNISGNAKNIYDMYDLDDADKKLFFTIIRNLSKFGILDIIRDRTSKSRKIKIQNLMDYVQSTTSTEFKDTINKLHIFYCANNAITTPTTYENDYRKLPEKLQFYETNSITLPDTFNPAFNDFKFLVKHCNVHYVFDAIRRFIKLPRLKTINIGWDSDTLQPNQRNKINLEEFEEFDQEFRNTKSTAYNPNDQTHWVQLTNEQKKIANYDILNQLRRLYFLFDLRKKRLLYSFVTNKALSKRFVNKFKRRLELIYKIIIALDDSNIPNLNFGISSTDTEYKKRYIIMEDILNDTLQYNLIPLNAEKLSNASEYAVVRKHIAALFNERIDRFTTYSIVNRLKAIIRKVTYKTIFDARQVQEKKFFGVYIRAPKEHNVLFETLQWFCVLKEYMKNNDILFSLLKIVKPETKIVSSQTGGDYDFDIADFNSSQNYTYNNYDNKICDGSGFPTFDASTFLISRNDMNEETINDIMYGNRLIGNKYDKGLENNNQHEKMLLQRILYPYPSDSSGYTVTIHDISGHTYEKKSSQNKTYYEFDYIYVDASGSTFETINEDLQAPDSKYNDYSADILINDYKDITKQTTSRTFLVKHFHYISNYLLSPDALHYHESFTRKIYDAHNATIAQQAWGTALHVNLQSELCKYIDDHNTLPFNNYEFLKWYFATTPQIQLHASDDTTNPYGNINNEITDLVKEKLNKNASSISKSEILDDIYYHCLSLIAKQSVPKEQEEAIKNNINNVLQEVILKDSQGIKINYEAWSDKEIKLSRNEEFYRKAFISNSTQKAILKDLSRPLKIYLNGISGSNPYIKKQNILFQSKAFILNEINLYIGIKNNSYFKIKESLISKLNEFIKPHVAYFNDIVNNIVLRYGTLNDYWKVFTDESEREDKLKEFLNSAEGKATIESITSRHYKTNSSITEYTNKVTNTIQAMAPHHSIQLEDYYTRNNNTVSNVNWTKLNNFQRLLIKIVLNDYFLIW